MSERDIYDSISPLDFRYYDEEVGAYLSENAFVRYKLRVELALVTVFQRRGVCSQDVLDAVTQACSQMTTAEVYKEEKITGHDIRALVRQIQAKISSAAKPFVHMVATSYDINDPANVARFKDVTELVLLNALRELLTVLVEITRREAATPQIGRTHGQHAVPITFGHMVAGYVSRLGDHIELLTLLSGRLRGKFSGAVGTYNASSLFFDDPLEFEREVLAELGLEPAEHSTQILPPEPLVRLFNEITVGFGIIADLANDMRQLQRSEIAEVGEAFAATQVGSSTMPQKRNPISFENVKSLWKTVVGRTVMFCMDQISEHQRDLTNSASSRTYGENIAYYVYAVKRLTKTMSKLTVDREHLAQNLASQGTLILAEPLQVILSALGHPEAHEVVKQLALQSAHQPERFAELVAADTGLKAYLERMTEKQRTAISDPLAYMGIAEERALAIADRWERQFGL